MSGKSKAQQHYEAQIAESEREVARVAQTAFHASFCRRATDYCMLGATNPELAAFFSVSLSAIERWLVEIPRFRQAVEKGRELADSKVSKAMFAAATGYKHRETKLNVVDGVLEKTEVTKHYAPNVAAGVFWLTNRQKAKWRDTKAVEHSGSVNLSHLVESSLGELAKPVDAKLIEQPSEPETEQ